MKTSPGRRDVTPNLTTVTGLGIPEAGAGNRTQSEAKQESYTGAKSAGGSIPPASFALTGG